MRPKISGVSETLKIAIGVAKGQSGHQKSFKFFCMQSTGPPTRNQDCMVTEIFHNNFKRAIFCNTLFS